MAYDDEELITSPGQVEGGPVTTPSQADTYGNVDMEPDADTDFVTTFDGIPDAPEVQADGGAIEMEGMDLSQGSPQRIGANVEVAGGQSAGFTGMTDRGMARAKGVFGEAQQRADIKNQGLESQYAADAARLTEAFTKKKAALAEIAGYEQEHHAALADIRKQQMDFNMTQAKLEELAWQKSQQGAAQYIQAYKQEMAGVRQMMMSTGNPLGGLTAVEGGALGAAMFAQGFLGSRGINVNVTGQVDRWVEREMQAHQQQIQNRATAAEGQLTLYNLARQGALDDVMTRQRLRGFVLDGLKSSIYLEAARFKSATAKADADVKASELDALMLSNEMAMRDKLVQHQQTNYQNEISAAKYQSDASIESYKTSVDAKYKAGMLKVAQDEEARKKAEQKPGKGGPSLDMLMIPDFGKPVRVGKDGKPDPAGKVTGYEVGWIIDPNMSETQYKAVSEKLSELNAGYGEIFDAMGRLREIKAKYGDAATGSTGVEAIDKRMSPGARQYQREWSSAVFELRHAIAGAQLTGSEKAEWDAFKGIDRLTESGGNDEALTQLEAFARRRFVKRAEAIPGVKPVPAGSGLVKPASDGQDETTARRDLELSPDKIPDSADEAAGAIKSVERQVPTGEEGSRLYKMYRASGGSRANANAPRDPNDVRGQYADTLSSMSQGQIELDRQVDKLVDIAVHPEKYSASKGPDDLAALSTNAITKLKEVSGDSQYAQWASSMMESQPEAVKVIMGD